jgi:hypothetical protein
MNEDSWLADRHTTDWLAWGERNDGRSLHENQLVVGREAKPVLFRPVLNQKFALPFEKGLAGDESRRGSVGRL